MPVYLGSTKEGTLYYGGTKIKEAYYGSTKVYSSFTPETFRFDYTGAVQTWTVPVGVNKLIIDCVGAGGGYSGTGGKGGRVQCKLLVTSGQILNIYVGGQKKWNGGSNTSGLANSGDASDIRIGGNSLNDRKVVAGGGGYGSGYEYGNGGAGGGLIGGDGGGASAYSGKGGTQSAGGNGGSSVGGITRGPSGVFGLGKGGGGGGWYGGGGPSTDGWGPRGSGGGGSSYTDPNLCSDVVHTQGYSEATGNGWIIITTSNQ